MVDNPTFVAEESRRGNSSSSKMGEKRDQRDSNSSHRSPYFFLGTPSSSSSGSLHSLSVSAHNLYHPGNYYYPSHEYPPIPSTAMWHRSRYTEEDHHNMPSALYPPMHGTHPKHLKHHTRRYSVASVHPIPIPQRQRRISVSRYQDILPGNYLKVPSFHDYEGHSNYRLKHPKRVIEIPSGYDYVVMSNRNSPPSTSKETNSESSRRKSLANESKPSSSKPSRSQSYDTSRSQSSTEENSKTQARSTTPSIIIERSESPCITIEVPPPIFEFTSNHLPLRPPPTTNMIRYSSGESGSMSTPESQRVESRQMISSTTSKKTPYSPQGEPRKDPPASKPGGATPVLSDNSIWSITKHTPKWCRHAQGKNCQSCNIKTDTGSQCSSVNPPPTFTALDTYQSARPRRRRCRCSCGAIFSVTMIIAVVVMLFIAAFILYVEMVLKHQTANVIDKM